MSAPQNLMIIEARAAKGLAAADAAGAPAMRSTCVSHQCTQDGSV